jgi:protein TonB
LFKAADYPREAIKNGWQGTVVAELMVDTHGNVERCTIIQSSGHDILDQKTCDVLRRRAKFSPARDSKGNATWDLFRTPPIIWGLAG